MLWVSFSFFLLALHLLIRPSYIHYFHFISFLFISYKRSDSCITFIFLHHSSLFFSNIFRIPSLSLNAQSYFSRSYLFSYAILLSYFFFATLRPCPLKLYYLLIYSFINLFFFCSYRVNVYNDNNSILCFFIVQCIIIMNNSPFKPLFHFCQYSVNLS